MKNKLMLVVLLAGSTYLYGVKIQRVVHHSQNDSQALELSVLEVYFSQQPCLDMARPVTDNAQHALVLQCSDLEISSVDSKKFQAVMGDGYAVSTAAHGNGSKIIITYDPEKVSVVCCPVVSISMQHGVVIRFFDQSVLKKLSDQTKPILSVAYLV